MRKIIIKEGPLVFLRNVLSMEILAALFFFGLSFVGNYSEVYRHWGLSDYVRFDLFEIYLFSAFQLVYLTLLFLDWYFTHFEITEKEIIKRSGLIFRRTKSVSLRTIISVETYRSLLGRFTPHHATITFEHESGRLTKIRNAADIEENMHLIKLMVQEATGRSLTTDPKVLLERGENQYVEFKETLRYDARKGEISRELEKMVLKTIVAFLNSEGGMIFIGVNDEGKAIGLERDYKVLAKKNKDGFENHLTMLVKTMIGLPFTKYVKTKFEEIDGQEICVVSVREAHKPAYLQNADKKEEFFVRVGNSTQPFSMSETEEYIKTRWK